MSWSVFFHKLSLTIHDTGHVFFSLDHFTVLSKSTREFHRSSTFDGDAKNLYLPHNLAKNLVLYLGTHDNDTTCGWYEKAGEEIRGNFRSYLNVSGEFPSWDLLRVAYRTVSPLVIVSVQDLLSLGSEARFNCPGEAIGNWQWRMNHSQLESLFESSNYLREQAKITGRSLESEKGS